MLRAETIGTFLTLLVTGGSLGCTVEPAGSDPMGSGGTSPTGMAGSGVSTPVAGGGGNAAVIPGGGMPGMGGQLGGSGETGFAGTFSASGSAGAGTAGTGGGGKATGPSPGCTNGAGLQDEPQKAIQHDLMVTTVADKYKAAYTTRKFYTNLPSNFDPAKPYPIMMYGQGCGQTGPESGPFSGGHFASEVLYVQLIPASVTGQTVVPSNGSPGCFQAGKQGFADSPDGPYFDMVLEEVKKNYCVDQARVYVAGWSSGAWLSNWLACARGNVITGTAAGSGGMFHDHGVCTGGGVRAMVMDGDAGNITEGGFPIGATEARDVLVMANGGAMPPTPTKFGSANCDVYKGSGDVAWCPVGGGHGGPLGSIAEAAWAFWNAP